MKLSLILVIILISTLYCSFAQPVNFKVVGYYSLTSALKPKETGKVPFKRLTHINLWFLNPDSVGRFTQDFSSLARFVRTAHKKNVQVLFSIGGGSKQPQYHWLLQDDMRAKFIEGLVSITVKYNIDGIDVDLEGSDIDENYEAFVVELAKALRIHNKLITAAVAVYYKDQLSDRALAEYDFVNIMSYDRTGPWRPERPGPHSTYLHATEDLDYFRIVRQIPAHKMTLGVPFYGYGFGPDLTSKAISMNYRQIVVAFRGAEEKDEWIMPDGKVLYYNGMPTMKQKASLAHEQASGIMIWQIQGDARGSKSLLKVINEVRKSE